jgi:hypothetical protein|tara:strand:- start:60 stop:326 length:267 start_codon:yes stop_codon:yes gene_type:complete
MTNKWKYIFASVFTLSLAIVAASYAPAIGQSRSSSYMIAAEQGNYIWRVNVGDGSVSFCVRETVNTTNPKYLSGQKPVCSASSGPAGH